MKLTTPFTALRNATSDMWRMHDFNYQIPKKDVRNLDYLKKLQTIEKTLKQSCINYPSAEDCLVCCN